MCHKTFRKSLHCISLPYCYLELKVTEKHENHGGDYGLHIPARFRFYGPEKAMQSLETRLTKIEKQLKESINYCLR